MSLNDLEYSGLEYLIIDIGTLYSSCTKLVFQFDIYPFYLSISAHVLGILQQIQLIVQLGQSLTLKLAYTPEVGNSALTSR